MDNIALIAGACMVAFIVWIFAPQKRERSAQPKHAKSKIPDFGYILPDKQSERSDYFTFEPFRL